MVAEYTIPGEVSFIGRLTDGSTTRRREGTEGLTEGGTEGEAGRNSKGIQLEDEEEEEGEEMRDEEGQGEEQKGCMDRSDGKAAGEETETQAKTQTVMEVQEIRTGRATRGVAGLGTETQTTDGVREEEEEEEEDEELFLALPPHIAALHPSTPRPIGDFLLPRGDIPSAALSLLVVPLSALAACWAPNR